MGILISVGTVLFVILSVLIIIVILLQSDKSAGMGLLGGSSQSAFGSSTADVITKITAVMVALFMVGSLGLSILESNRVEHLESKVLKSDSSSKGMLEKSTSAEENKKTEPAKNK